MMRKIQTAVCAAILVALPTFVAPAYAQDEVNERTELIEIQNALRLFREFEHASRHLHFLMTTAIISLEGGWMARGEAEGLSYAENLREVAKNQYLPTFNRFLSRLENNKNLNDDEKTRMASVAEQMLELIALSKVIGDELDAGNGDAVNTLFQEQAFPLFKSIWATNYTLISEAERRFPRR